MKSLDPVSTNDELGAVSISDEITSSDFYQSGATRKVGFWFRSKQSG
jgi:hypothetical protein